MKWLSKYKKQICLLVFIGIMTVFSVYGGLSLIIEQKNQDFIQGQPDIMIILGCQVTDQGPSQTLRDRLDKALEYLAENPDMTIIVSGGQGSNEPTTEAYGMAQYLIESGVPESSIYQEGRSSNTFQNLAFSCDLMQEEGLSGDILIVSSGFHLARSSMLWERLQGDSDELSFLAAPVTYEPYAKRNKIREPLAFIKSFLFDHE